MIKGLDHIAIAVSDLGESIKRFTEDLGLSLDGKEDVASAETAVAFFPVNSVNIELVCPLNNQGPIKKYLEKHGGGLHHICFSTDDITSDMEMLKNKGYKFVSDVPSIGAHGNLIAWIDPRYADGVLIELVEK